MSSIMTRDGVRLHVEEAGSGTPIIFVHEFGGDHRSWEPQMRYFARRYRCISFAARGFPPSDIPDDVARYGQAIATDDIADVLSALAVDRAHVIGLSMGGTATVEFGLRYPQHALSLVVASAGLGSERRHEAHFRAVSLQIARDFETQGAAEYAKTYALGPSRIPFLLKDARGWRTFAGQLAEHSAVGSARTMQGVQARRPSLYDFEAGLATMTVPTLVIVGDEDDHCLQPALFLKRTIPASGLVVLPKTGHVPNLEEPALFNQFVADFLASVELGKWLPRDPRSRPPESQASSGP